MLIPIHAQPSRLGTVPGNIGGECFALERQHCVKAIPRHQPLRRQQLIRARRQRRDHPDLGNRPAIVRVARGKRRQELRANRSDSAGERAENVACRSANGTWIRYVEMPRHSHPQHQRHVGSAAQHACRVGASTRRFGTRRHGRAVQKIADAFVQEVLRRVHLKRSIPGYLKRSPCKKNAAASGDAPRSQNTRGP